MARTAVSTAGAGAGGSGSGATADADAGSMVNEEMKKLIQLLAAEKTALSAALQEVGALFK